MKEFFEKQWKRVISFVLALVMVLGCIGVMPEVKAATNDMAIESVLNFSTSAGDWRFNFNMTGTWPTAGGFDTYLPDFTITIQNATGDILDTPTSLENYKNGNYWLLCIWGAHTGSYAPAEGDTITISSGQMTAANDASAVVNFANEMVLRYDGSAWSLYVEQNIAEMGVNSVENFTPGSDWRFNLNMTGTWPTNGSFDQYVAKDFTITMKNKAGETLAGGADYYKNAGYMLIVIWGEHTAHNAPVEGDTITLSSGKLAYSGDENTLINFSEETVLIYDGSTWSVYVEQTIAEMGVDSVANFTPGSDWRFNLNMIGAWPTSGDFDQYLAKDFTITMKNKAGETLAGGADYYKNAGYMLIVIWGEHTANNAPVEGDTITLSSGKLAYASDENTLINFTEETVLIYDGSTWSVYVEQTIAEMGVDSVANFTPGSDWRLNLNMTGAWPTSGDFDQYLAKDFTITMKNKAGETLAGGADYYKNAGYMLIVIWGEHTAHNAPVEGDTITLSSGKLAYSGDENTLINFSEETVLIYDGTAWSVYVDQTIAEMEVDSVANFTAGSDWRFNLNMIGAWPTSGDFDQYVAKDFTITMRNKAGETLAGGADYYKNTGCMLIVIWGEHTAHNAPVEGDTITLSSGKLAYSGDTNTLIRLEKETILEYNGTSWVAILSDSGVDADVNSDMSVSSSDLVRLLRHRSNATVAINEEREDINYDDAKDEVDENALRKVLLGMIYYKKDASSPSTPYGTPQYYNTDTIERMAYACPKISEFQRYKDAGLTLLNTEFVAPLKNDSLTEEVQADLVAYLKEAQKFDLGVIVYSDLLCTLLEYEGDINAHPNYGSNWKDLLALYVDFLDNYPAFKGFVMSDELTIKSISNYTIIANYLKSLDPDLMLKSSQLPVYAYDNSKWGPDALTTNTSVNNTKDKAYKDYVTQFGTAMGHFTYDNYSLYFKEAKYFGSDDWYVHNNWHENLEYVSEVAKQNGFTTGITIQSCYLKGSDGLLSNTNRYAPENKEDIGFQVYTALAFGMQDINFYTYNLHKTDKEVLVSINTNSNVYNAVKNVNSELNTFANVFKSFTWKDTLGISSGETYSSTDNDSRLQKVTSSAAKVYVGCMKDVDGFDGYMVANADDPRDAANTKVTLTFNNATHVLVYKNGKKETVALSGNEYTVEVDAGEGAFVIPLRIEG